MRQVTVVPGEYISGRDAVLYLGNVPVMYYPYYRRSLKRHPNNFVFTPGYRNRFGHPRAEVVARYVRAGSRLFRTDLDGAITLMFGPMSDAIAERAIKRRYWYDPPQPSATTLE